MAITTWDASNFSYNSLLSNGNLTVEPTFAGYLHASDFDANKHWIFNPFDGLWNGASTATQDPATGTGGYSYTGNAGPFYAMDTSWSASPVDVWHKNFGSLPTPTLPSGFSMFNTAASATVTFGTAFNGNFTYSNGDLRATRSAGSDPQSTRSSHTVSSGKVCWMTYPIRDGLQRWGFGNGSNTAGSYFYDGGQNGAGITNSLWVFNGATTGTTSFATNTYRRVPQLGFGTVSRSSGKLMFEITGTFTTNNIAVGVGNSSAALTSYPGAANSWGYTVNNPNANTYYNGGSATGADGLTTGGTIGIYVDFGAQRLWYYSSTGGRYNSSPSADPATNTGGIDISAIMGSALFPVCGGAAEGAGVVAAPCSIVANFGASAFSSPVPSGFRSWNDGPLVGGRSRGIIIP